MEPGGSYNGVAFGPGTRIHVQEIEGLDLPDIRSSDEERFMDHGLLMGRDLVGGRTVTITFGLRGDDRAGLETVANDMRTMYRPQDTELPLYINDSSQAVYCRPRRASFPRDLTYSQRTASVTVQWVATDPRIYSATENLTTIPAPVASGGAHWPLDWAPLDWGVNGTTGIVILNNAGSFATPFRAQLVSGTNSYVGPFVENVTTGQILRFSNFTIPAGEWVDFDSLNRTVLANGTASRSNYLTPGSDWFNLKPGDNEIRLGAFTSQPGAGLHVRWRSAWI